MDELELFGVTLTINNGKTGIKIDFNGEMQQYATIEELTELAKLYEEAIGGLAVDAVEMLRKKCVEDEE